MSFALETKRLSNFSSMFTPGRSMFLDDIYTKWSVLMIKFNERERESVREWEWKWEWERERERIKNEKVRVLDRWSIYDRLFNVLRVPCSWCLVLVNI